MKTLILHFHLGCSGGGVKIEGGVDLSILYGKWGPVTMYVIDPSKTPKRSVFALSTRVPTRPDKATLEDLSMSMAPVLQDISDLCVEIMAKFNSHEQNLVSIGKTQSALCLNVIALQNGPL